MLGSSNNQMIMAGAILHILGLAIGFFIFMYMCTILSSSSRGNVFLFILFLIAGIALLIFSGLAGLAAVGNTQIKTPLFPVNTAGPGFNF